MNYNLSKYPLGYKCSAHSVWLTALMQINNAITTGKLCNFNHSHNDVVWFTNLLQEPRGEDVVETGQTDLENAISKVSFIPFSLNV